MSYFSHAFHKVFVGNGTIKTTGTTADLAAGEIGLYDYTTFKALADASVNPNPKKMFIVAQGSHHTVDSLSPFFGGLQESVKSRGINPAFIEKFYKAEASSALPDVWTVGYNGVTSECNCISGSCDNKYSLRIDVKGDSASRLFNRNLYRVISVDTPCCGTGCDVCTDTVVDPLWIAKQFVEKINTDMQLKEFVYAELVYETIPTFTENDQLIFNISVSGTNVAGVEGTYTDFISVTSPSSGVYIVTIPGDSANPPLTGDTIGGQAVTVNSTSVLFARELCMTVVGLTDLTSDIDDFYTDRTDVEASTIKTTGTSAITYSIIQHAEAAVTVGVDTVGVPTYDDLPSFEGNVWGTCPCPADETPYSSCIGIKLTAAYEDTRFGNCSFKPLDYYNVQPLKIYVSKVDDAELCTDAHMNWTITHLQESKQASGLGETVLRDYMLFMGYKQEYFEHDPRMREVMDQQHLSVIDRTKSYNTYYLIHSIPNHLKGQNVKSYDEKYVLVFFFESTINTAAFEAHLEGYTQEVAGVDLETI